LEEIEKLHNKHKEKQLKDQESELKNEINVLRLKDKWVYVDSKLNEKTTSVKSREIITEKERKIKNEQEKGKFSN